MPERLYLTTEEWIWRHPMEGKHQKKWMDHAWYSRIFGPLGAPGELEKTFRCHEKDLTFI
jgi:hypothetical protein